MKTICGIDCTGCAWKDECKGCAQTDGCPFGAECIAAKCYKSGGENCFIAYKQQLIKEFNNLGITDMPLITELCPLKGAYVNLSYTLPNGQEIKILEDNKIYLGYQVERENSDRCYGLVTDDNYLLERSYAMRLFYGVPEDIENWMKLCKIWTGARRFQSALFELMMRKGSHREHFMKNMVSLKTHSWKIWIIQLRNIFFIRSAADLIKGYRYENKRT